MNGTVDLRRQIHELGVDLDKPQHRLLEKNPETRRGVCEIDGPVKIMPHRNSWRCSVVNRLNQRAGHGMNTAERLAYLDGKVCEVCGSTKRLVPDHNHITKKVRGPLCWNCNLALGHLGDGHDIERIENLLKYARKHLDSEPPLG